MIDWQTLLSLLIVAAAAIQLARLLMGKKTKCSNCSDRCYAQKGEKESLVQLEDLGHSRKV